MNRENWIVGGLVSLFALSIVVSAWRGPNTITGFNSKGPAKNGIAVVDLYGTIEVSPQGMWQPGSVESVIEALRQTEKDKRVKGVVLRVNSPGGHVGSGQELFHAIMQYRMDSKKPVVVSVTDYGASAAYWVAMGADHIVANPGSLVGSMGVIAQMPDLTRIQQKYGVGMRTYKAGQFKDMNSPWRGVSEREKIIMQRMLDNIHRQFIDVVVSRRKISPEQAELLADGRVYTGEQAISLGLIDSLGGLSDAVNICGKMAGLGSKPHVIRHYQGGFMQFFDSFRH
ncbi:MAG: signal peptide peptidase SppA, partial [bacterium]|nr:signal peptide peptidase SppA [bacterium]